MAAPVTVAAADVWIAYFDPVVGHEQGGRRPAVVVSGEILHAIPSQLVFLVPATTRELGVRTHVALNLNESGLPRVSFAMTEQIRSVSVRRLRKRVGTVDARTLAEIRHYVSLFMDMDLSNRQSKW